MSYGIGVVGYGYWGPNLVRNFAESDGAEVIFVCDRDEERLLLAKKRYPGIDTTTSYQKLLEDKRIQAVAIATPVSTHFDLAMSALEARKHVFIEKPLAETSAKARRLLEKAKEVERVLMVDHTFLYTGAIRKIKSCIQEEKLGQLRYFDSVRINLGLFQHDVNVLWDLAPHDFSILNYWVDETPVAIQAVGAKHVYEHANTAYVSVFYESGFIAHCHLNWLSPVKIRQIILCGDKRMIVYDDVNPTEKIKIYDCGVEPKTRQEVYQQLVDYRTGDILVPRFDMTEALKVEVREFLECLEGTMEPTSGGEMGLLVVRMLEAAQQSMDQEGKRVKL